MDIAIHANPSMPHQVRYAKYIKSGFDRHNLQSAITIDPARAADLHVVIGPHFALEYWKNHDNTILVDRCFYRGDPEHVSMGWLKNGQREFKIGVGREPPEIQDKAGKAGTIFLADYGGPVERADTVRLHPAQERPKEPLEQALCRHRTAIGYSSTALVTAGLLGLQVTSRAEGFIMNNPDWLKLLPYADWYYNEIQTGHAWEHLCQSK